MTSFIVNRMKEAFEGWNLPHPNDSCESHCRHLKLDQIYPNLGVTEYGLLWIETICRRASGKPSLMTVKLCKTSQL